MTGNQWRAFCAFRDEYRFLCNKWQQFSGELYPLQKQLADSTAGGYKLETPVVYNRAFDDVRESDEIRYIIVADNPGKQEQLATNQRYLVGFSGKLAEGFFARTPSLNTDFRKNVLVLNKTPIHTAKTVDLKTLFQAASKTVQDLILETQRECARLTFRLHEGLLDSPTSFLPQLWIIGYAEMKRGKILCTYRDELFKLYENRTSWNNVFVYQHFSMNRFSIELNKFLKDNQTSDVVSALGEIGRKHKEVVFSDAF